MIDFGGKGKKKRGRKPKIKTNGVIGGHDYVEPWNGVIQAVDEIIGKPDMVHIDGSWIKYL